MEAMIFLDTHVVIWLYAGEVERFPRRVQSRLESEALFISPIVLLEMQGLTGGGASYRRAYLDH